MGQERFAELDQDNRIWWGPDGDSMPRLKCYLSELKRGVVPRTLWPHTEVGHTQDAKKELVSAFWVDRFFPADDDSAGHRALLERVPSLDTFGG